MTQMLSFSIGFTVNGLDRGDVEALFHIFGDSLHAIEARLPEHVLDHAVSVDLEASRFEVELTTQADDAAQAEDIARSAVNGMLEHSGGRPAGGVEPGTVGSAHAISGAELVSRAAFQRSGFEVLARELVDA